MTMANFTMASFYRIGLSALGVLTGFWGVEANSVAQAATLRVDRGLPETLTQENVVRWAPSEAYDGDPEAARFKGDEFTIDADGQNILLQSLNVFVAPGFDDNNPESLADWFESIFLRVDQGAQDGDLSERETVAAGSFDAATNSIDNPDIMFSNTGEQYVSASQAQADIWKVEFSNLNVTLPSTEPVRFGVKGVGRQIGDSDFSFPLFLMASNSALSDYDAAQNVSTDDTYLEFLSDGSFERRVNSAEEGWDKSSDILVQARAQVMDNNQPGQGVPEPSFWLGLAGVAAYGIVRKHRGAKVRA